MLFNILNFLKSFILLLSKCYVFLTNLVHKLMPCCLYTKLNTLQKTRTTIAIIKSCPPSPFDSIPSTMICDKIAPLIKPIPKNAPANTVEGINSNIPVINSIMPVPILPQGSTPSLVNISTDSG